MGDRNIVEAMKKKDFILGGEPSGHIILNNNLLPEMGLLASLEVLGIMKKQNKKLSELSNVYQSYPQVNSKFSNLTKTS